MPTTQEHGAAGAPDSWRVHIETGADPSQWIAPFPSQRHFDSGTRDRLTALLQKSFRVLTRLRNRAPFATLRLWFAAVSQGVMDEWFDASHNSTTIGIRAFRSGFSR